MATSQCRPTTHADTHTPPNPTGGVRRAIPRDALTGEPIRSDTLHIRVRGLDARQSSDHSAIMPQPRRLRKAAVIRYSSAPLPVLRLDDLVDEDAADAADNAGDEEADDA